MPRGDQSKFTERQERKADHIAESYEKKGVGDEAAERRAWATVNNDDGSGKMPGGSDRGVDTGHPVAHEGDRKGGKTAASCPAAARSASGKDGGEAQAVRSLKHIFASGMAGGLPVPRFSGYWCDLAALLEGSPRR